MINFGSFAQRNALDQWSNDSSLDHADQWSDEWKTAERCRVNKGVPNSRLDKKQTISSWKRHMLCDSVLTYGRNRWEFEHVIRNSMANEIWSI